MTTTRECTGNNFVCKFKGIQDGKKAIFVYYIYQEYVPYTLLVYEIDISQLMIYINTNENMYVSIL